MFLRWIPELAVVGKIPLPSFSSANPLKLAVPVSPLFLGIGALLTFPTAVLVFAGGLINSATKSYAAEYGLADETYRWVGGAAMAMAVAYSLVNYLIEGRRKSTADDGNKSGNAAGDDRLLEISAPMRIGLLSAIGIGAVLLFAILAGTELTLPKIAALGVVSLILVGLLSGLGGLLSLQVGASASPVSGTVFMAMLVLSLSSIALGQTGFIAIATLPTRTSGLLCGHCGGKRQQPRL